MTLTLEEHAAMQAQIMAAIPHARAIGIEVLGVEGRTCVARVPFRDDLVGDPESRIIAGGVVTTLLDHIGGSAVAVALREFRSIATLDLRIDYMRPAAPGTGVTAEAECTKITRSVAFIRAVAYDQTKDDPVATAVGVYMLGAEP
jgi:uncharacterized protein (TIGR00369 family)